MEWTANCHHDHNLEELADKFIHTVSGQRLLLFYVYGHSYEFEMNGSWEVIEDFKPQVYEFFYDKRYSYAKRRLEGFHTLGFSGGKII